jgi:hypothetical protein
MPSAFRNGGLIGVPTEYASIYEPIKEFAFIASTSAIDNNNLIVSTSAKAGDLAILTDNVESAGVVSSPSGWTAVLEGSAGGTDLSVTVAYKILTASDIGATVTSTNASTTHHFMQISVVGTNNPNSAFSSVAISGLLSTVTTGNPAAQNIVLTSTPTFGVVVYAQRGSNGQMSISTTPVNDALATTLDGANIKIRTHFNFFGTGTTPATAPTSATMTMDLADGGSQGQVGFIVTPTSATGVQAYNSGIWSLDAVSDTTYFL